MDTVQLCACTCGHLSLSLSLYIYIYIYTHTHTHTSCDHDDDDHHYHSFVKFRIFEKFSTRYIYDLELFSTRTTIVTPNRVKSLMLEMRFSCEVIIRISNRIQRAFTEVKDAWSSSSALPQVIALQCFKRKEI